MRALDYPLLADENIHPGVVNWGDAPWGRSRLQRPPRTAKLLGGGGRQVENAMKLRRRTESGRRQAIVVIGLGLVLGVFFGASWIAVPVIQETFSQLGRGFRPEPSPIQLAMADFLASYWYITVGGIYCILQVFKHIFTDGRVAQ